MRTIRPLLASAILILSGCGGGGGTETVPVTATVTMPGFVFAPVTTRIAVGGTVRFEFPATPHNVIFDRITGAPADIQETSNQTVPRTFAVAGTFPFDCTLHPGMSGEVVVR